MMPDLTIPPYPDQRPGIGDHLERVAGELAAKVKAGLYDALESYQRADLVDLSHAIALAAEHVHELERETAGRRRTTAPWWRRLGFWLATRA